MNQLAHFYFYTSLTDFLPPGKRNRWLSYPFTAAPAIKDAIEAIGIPHPEVKAILANRMPVDFSHPLQPQEQVVVFPFDYPLSLPEGYALRDPYRGPCRFILDVHLGKLSRALRMLGFDSSYENDYSDQAIADRAEKEQRIVLSRDVGLLKHKKISWGYWLRSQHPPEQLQEVVRHYKLHAAIRPFVRCLSCNGLIERVPKEEVADRLPPRTRQYFNEFFQCSSCGKIYWKGSHYERMQNVIESISPSSDKER